MSSYWFNRQEILQKAKETYSKEKAAEYYSKNKEAIKEKSKERYKNLSQEKKTRLKSTKEKDISNWFSTKKKHYRINIRMSEKRLKFNNIWLNKKEFHKSKQPIDLMSLNADQMVVSE